MADSTPAPAPANDNSPAPSPGWRTSEFWLKLAAILLTALFASGVIPTSGTVATVTAIAATMLGALGYTVSRSMVKSAAVKAALLAVLVGGLAAPQMACGARAPATRAASAFMDCESPDLAPLLPDAIQLAKAAVLRWISGAGTVSTDGLKTDAKPLRTDLARCAWDAAVAAIAQTGPAPAPGAPAASAMSIDGPALTSVWANVRSELGWPQHAAAQ